MKRKRVSCQKDGDYEGLEERPSEFSILCHEVVDRHKSGDPGRVDGKKKKTFLNNQDRHV